MTSQNLLPHPRYAKKAPVPEVEKRLEESRRIMEKALSLHLPYATISMVSGGRDSICAYYVAKKLGIFVTHILHGVTETGIEDTTDFVRSFGEHENVIYVEAPAGGAYEEYVMRKGFFGVGSYAHQFSYHTLKSRPFRSAITQIRGTAKHRKILLLTGARMEESARRASNDKVSTPIRSDRGNIWINILHTWRKIDRDVFLEDIGAQINPVTKVLCRSGECMCGTMQSLEDRREASFYYPKWGAWLDNLEKSVKYKWDWGWGEHRPHEEEHEESSEIVSFPQKLMCRECTREDKP